MKLILRWHGPKDPVPLKYYAQIPGIYGVVTSMYHQPLGEEWDRDSVLALKKEVEDAGLKLEVIDSFRIHEDIKRGYETRDALIENYKKNIRMLAECGIKVICYNFMPVFDWTRTNMNYLLSDGSDCLAFEVSKVKSIDPEKGIDLPGWGTNYSPEKLQELLHSYQDIGEEKLWENCLYFLEQCVPVAEECGVKLALHPDDPPSPIFGLPRIAKNVQDYRRILNAVPSPSNCITFCCGSFGSAAENDMPAMIREFGKEKIPFVHFRNIKRFPDGSFYESGHITQSGSSDMGEVMKALHEIGFDGFIRPDHGRRIWDEQGAVPGYGLYDRALGAAYINGLWEGIEKA